MLQNFEKHSTELNQEIIIKPTNINKTQQQHPMSNQNLGYSQITHIHTQTLYISGFYKQNKIILETYHK